MFDAEIEKLRLSPDKRWILFRAKGRRIGGQMDENGQVKQYAGVEDFFVLNCEGSHAHPEKVDYYLSKGFALVKWNLPDRKDDPSEGAVVNFGDDVNHFRRLRTYCERMIRQDTRRTMELERQVKELTDRNMEMAAKLAKAAEAQAETERLKKELRDQAAAKSNKPQGEK